MKIINNMNAKIDLTKILKDCPEGTKLYSTIYGDVKFHHIATCSPYPIIIENAGGVFSVTKRGMHIIDYEDNAECTLFPSKDQRDWSKFTTPWHKKERFDPKTLKPFDKVLARIDNQSFWCCQLFSFIDYIANTVKCCGAYYQYCIPYNDDTKHLVGTKKEAPDFYRYWED